MDGSALVTELTRGLAAFDAGRAVMIFVGVVLIALAVIKEYEPVLLLPIGFGCILANIPMTGMTEQEYRDMMIGGGRSIEGNRFLGEDGDAQPHRQPQGAAGQKKGA